MIRVYLIIAAIAFAACNPAFAATYAYSNDGLSMRAVPDGYSPAGGEVVFTAIPSVSQLQAAFPNYNTALIAATSSIDYLSKILNGMALVSTGAPSLNGNYAIDDSNLGVLAFVGALNVAGKGFPPGNITTFVWIDIAGTSHTFTGTQFLNFATAVRDYRYNLAAVARSRALGNNTAWPNVSTTIP